MFMTDAHADEVAADLGVHLSALGREGLIDARTDRNISAGQEWAGSIDANLEQAAIVLLLVSASFLASTHGNDRPPALTHGNDIERAASAGTPRAGRGEGDSGDPQACCLDGGSLREATGAARQCQHEIGRAHV